MGERVERGETAESLKRAIGAQVDVYVACACEHVVFAELGYYAGVDARVPKKVCGILTPYAAERAEAMMHAHFPGFRVRVYENGEAYLYREPSWAERWRTG